MAGLHAVPIRRSLIRPSLVLGGERTLVLSTLMLCAMLIFGVLTWSAFFLGILLWVIGLMALRRMAKADPQLSQVYLRHIRYRLSYDARSRPSRTQ